MWITRDHDRILFLVTNFLPEFHFNLPKKFRPKLWNLEKTKVWKFKKSNVYSSFVPGPGGGGHGGPGGHDGGHDSDGSGEYDRLGKFAK